MNIAPQLTQQEFAKTRLLAADFDGTVALTFEKSPGGIGVTEACELAIEQIFGAQGLDDYKKSGGLRNRAPVEVIQQLAPDAHGEVLAALVERFIELKLEVLISEIGTRFDDGSMWPRPTEGYMELLQAIEEAQKYGVVIDHLILSSGHEGFIRRTYEKWGVRIPDYLLADETVSRLHRGDSPRPVKPAPELIVMAHEMWAGSYGIHKPTLSHDTRRMHYVGDDPEKDGLMAWAAGVDFTLQNPGDSLEIWRSVPGKLLVGLGSAARRGANVG